MLKKIGLIVLIVFSFFSCKQNPTNTKKENKEVLDSNTGYSLSYEVLENGYNKELKTKSRLILTNNTGETIQKDDWTIYFNLCRKVLQDSTDNKEVMFSHISGDFFKIEPTSDFKALAKGDSIIIDFVSEFWVTTKYEAPQGFYIVQGDKIHNITDYTVLPFTREEQIKRSLGDNWAAHTAELAYAQNKNTTQVTKLPPFLPSPYHYTYGNEDIKIKTISVEVGEDFTTEAELLKENIKDFKLETKEGTDLTVRFKQVTLLPIPESTNPEGYKLHLSEDEGVLIEAITATGAFYGVQSLKSILLNAHVVDGGLSVRELDIVDCPQFSFRGMMLDVGRNFQKKKAVLKLLDMMAFYKLNKFHFHITDDEGWRIEIEGLPELTDIGSKRGHTLTENDMLHPAYGSGPDASAETNNGSGYYTKADFIEILKYANERHIEVIPEIDVPGHVRAAIIAMKARYNRLKDTDLAAAEQYLLHDAGDTSKYESVQMFNDNVACICQESTYNFITKVFDEVIAMYKEAGVPITTIHTGGDEVPNNVWEGSPKCAEMIAQNPKDVKNHLTHLFLQRLNKIIGDRGLVTAGWEEIGMMKKEENGKTVHIPNPEFINSNFRMNAWQSVYGWGAEDYAYQLANTGYPIVLSNATSLYMDFCHEKHPEELGFYWAGYVNTKKIFEFTPYDLYKCQKNDRMGNPLTLANFDDKVKLNPNAHKNILGIQGQLWSETLWTGQDRMEYMLYPRLVALAERAWTKTPEWAEEYNVVESQTGFDKQWSAFASKMGADEYSVLNYLGVNMRVPTPGAKIEEGKLYANVAFPGLDIRYTTNGEEPSESSPLYTEPVTVNDAKDVKIAVFIPNSDRRGRVITLR